MAKNTQARETLAAALAHVAQLSQRQDLVEKQLEERLRLVEDVKKDAGHVVNTVHLGIQDRLSSLEAKIKSLQEQLESALNSGLRSERQVRHAEFRAAAVEARCGELEASLERTRAHALEIAGGWKEVHGPLVMRVAKLESRSGTPLPPSGLPSANALPFGAPPPPGHLISSTPPSRMAAAPNAGAHELSFAPMPALEGRNPGELSDDGAIGTAST